MSRVLVGVFDSLADAKALYEELVKRLGIAPREVRVTAARPGAAGGLSGVHAPTVQTSVDRSNTVQGSVGEMFRALFVEMGGRSDDERLYDEAVHRGATVVMVAADSEHRVQEVMAAMQRHRVLDLEARGEPARLRSTAPDRGEQPPGGDLDEQDERRRATRFATRPPGEASPVPGVRVYPRAPGFDASAGAPGSAGGGGGSDRSPA